MFTFWATGVPSQHSVVSKPSRIRKAFAPVLSEPCPHKQTAQHSKPRTKHHPPSATLCNCSIRSTSQRSTAHVHPDKHSHTMLPAPAAAYVTACCVRCFLWLSHIVKASIRCRSRSMTALMAAFLCSSCCRSAAACTCRPATAAASASAAAPGCRTAAGAGGVRDEVGGGSNSSRAKRQQLSSLAVVVVVWGSGNHPTWWWR